MRFRVPCAFASWIGLSVAAAAQVSTPPASQPVTTQPATTQSAAELKLEELFPEKGLFGPSASGMAFSHDGKFAAYLYRPYRERRHGNDLWLLDTGSGTVRRVTAVSVMSRFQADTREVRDDRIKKAKEEKNKQGTTEPSSQPQRGGSGDQAGAGSAASQAGATTQAATQKSEAQDALADYVTENDADDEKAPRYDGVNAFTWSPVANELLFVSGGDVYRLTVPECSIERQTGTRESERDVQYLPDGSGFTYLRDGALLRVKFGSHVIDQLDPKLGEGERMNAYRLSPDGARIVFVSYKRGRSPEPQRTVNIARYNERFMQVERVPRTVSEDPLTPSERSIYLYELNEPLTEDGKLWKVYTHEESGPRDFLPVPEWALDSSRVVFATYEQATGAVEILEADFPPRNEKQSDDEQPTGNTSDDRKKVDEGEGEREKEQKREDDGGQPKDDKPKDESPARERKARVVYRFLHTGGPNTPYMIHPYFCGDGRRIVFISEISGFRQLHVLDPLYEALTELTHGYFEVYPIDISKDHQWIFVTATKDDPARREIFRVRLSDGTLEPISRAAGDYTDVAVCADGSKALANYATFGKLPELVYCDTAAEAQRVLTDSHPEKAHEYTRVMPEFFTYPNRHGQTIYGYLFKPEGWTAADKRPLLIYVYGGPLGERKMVVDGTYSSDGYFFGYYMARKHGFVTCVIDPRGASGYGGLFEKSNFEQVGKPQVEDLVDGVKWFVANQGVDGKRVGVHGWSFGGFQTQMCLYTEPDVFAAGIAGAGPTEWENYNSWYSTGTIGPSRAGKPDLEKYSLLPLAKNLKARLLLVHGMEDDNVLYQDTVRVYRELLKAGKETLVELFLDPTGKHHLGGDVKRLARFRKYEEFLVRVLGEGAPASEPQAAAPAADAAQEQAVAEAPTVKFPVPDDADFSPREYYTKGEYRVPMRDGIRLFTSVYAPRDTTQTYPILLVRTPYAVDPYGEGEFPGHLGPSASFARKGYIFVFQDVRGRFMSEGRYENMRAHIDVKRSSADIDESSDTYDTIDWLLKNVPNHNGRVGQWGISYPGFYSSAGMVDAHPALQAVSPQAPIADWFFDDFHHHGAFLLPHFFHFFDSFGKPRTGLTTKWPAGLNIEARDGYAFYLELGPLSNINARHYHHEIPFWEETVAHPDYDAFWQSRNILPHLKNVAPAVMTVGGWFDAEDLYGTFNTYQAVEEQNPGIANTIVVGPWRHGGWGGGPGESFGGVEFGSATGEFYRENILEPFFEHHLRGAPDPELPEAYMFETGTNRWQRFDDWPPASTTEQTLWINDAGSLSRSAPEDWGVDYDEFVSDPDNPVPYTATESTHMVAEYMVEDQRFVADRADAPSYQTEVLEQDLTLAGPVIADLWVSTSGGGSDWVVKLIDVFPDEVLKADGTRDELMSGYQLLVRSEVFRGRYRNSYEHPEPFEANVPARVQVPLQDVLHTFRKGHRLKVQVQCSWFPLVDRNPQKWVENIYRAAPEDFQKATQRLFHSQAHPTRLRVGVLPSSAE